VLITTTTTEEAYVPSLSKWTTFIDGIELLDDAAAQVRTLNFGTDGSYGRAEMRKFIEKEISLFDICTLDEYQSEADAHAATTRQAAFDILWDTADEDLEAPVTAWLRDVEPVRNFRSSLGYVFPPELVSVEMQLSTEPLVVLTISAVQYEAAELSISLGNKTVVLDVDCPNLIDRALTLAGYDIEAKLPDIASGPTEAW
jgi:hypothetical protein